MRGLLIAVVVLIAFALLLKAVKAKKTGAITEEPWPVKAKKPLGDRERVVYFTLRLALPEYVVLAQVAISQLISVKGKGIQAIRNKISPLVADFVVCDKSFQVLAVIELDGNSHDHPRRQRADQNKEKALTGAGLKLLRWNTKLLPSKDEMREAVLS